ncbi:hypothetical protein UB33_06795 [Photobacterium angustum]|uniref:metallophosphoesterase family protein n=1 Tax=Photobacterium angustum TaxID=661 RepID=UPI0005DBE4B5|nr:metallophosphoesterase [Photobacterium angustum]KJG06961.1 hypothetical protein UB33_06795 [Photobacterium angustum]PSV95056.1 hypothetical protein CTN01_05570 [Photobacterium angustum]
MKRRDFLRLSALGLSIYTLPGCRSSHKDNNNNDYQSPFEIPGYDGKSHRFAVIGDNHNDCNILKGMLEEAEKQGIKDILLLGDQVDSYRSSKGNTAGYLADGYMRMIKENGFDKKLNFYPIRGNHDTYTDNHDKSYYQVKHFYNNHVGTLVDESVITRPEYLQTDFNPLDCCSTYSFMLGNTLFVALDFFFTYRWTGESDIHLTTLHDEVTDIYQGDEWLLNKEFIENTIEKNKGKFNNIIVFGHYPFAGHNHKGDLRDQDQLGRIEEEHPGFTESLLSLFANNNITYLCGHDHHVAKSLIYPSGDVSYLDNINSSSSDAFEQPNFIQMICGSSSYKHYENEYTFLDGYEVPLYLQHTRGVRDNTQIEEQAPETTNHMMLVEVRGSLMNMTMIGNNHNWQTSDGKYSDDDGFKKSLDNPDAEQFYLEPQNWHISSVTNLFANNQSVVVPPNGSYETNIPSANFSGSKSTVASITSGQNITFNGLRPTEGANEECLDVDFAEQVSFVWLKSRQEKVLSDVLFIDGMQEQTGVDFDEFGNVVNDMPWYIEPKPKTDSFTLTFKTKLPSSISDGVTIACYDEESEQWESLNTSYQDGCFISENVSQNGFFAIVER